MFSAGYSDVDKNGILRMMLCHVIMGNAEVIPPGSKQFQPSNENFDSGVVDLQNPKHYVVWEMNVNTHIYPEYVVTIKVPLKAKGNSFGFLLCFCCFCSPAFNGSTSNESVVTRSSFPHSLLQDGGIRTHPAFPNQSQNPMFSGAPRVPTSPWMPFSMLFAAISTKASPQDMDLVNTHCGEFKTISLLPVGGGKWGCPSPDIARRGARGARQDRGKKMAAEVSAAAAAAEVIVTLAVVAREMCAAVAVAREMAAAAAAREMAAAVAEILGGD
uniref:PARP catalytic domain-containing protein n=1 Tax=Ananas comosus var. bracteatus TaxID=296719 RepID=A0A6V7NJ40_ANACO|nr:unnamed protein product [Ananas comosus var. bracteatus]